MCYAKRQDVYAEQSYGEYHEVEVLIVSLAHTVTNPWAVVIKSL